MTETPLDCETQVRKRMCAKPSTHWAGHGTIAVLNVFEDRGRVAHAYPYAPRHKYIVYKKPLLRVCAEVPT
jgi:hypothetical protein